MTAYVSDTTASPWSSVVKIIATFANGTKVSGSGVVVGANDVLTASHVVWDAQWGEAVKLEIYPGLDGSTQPFGSFVADEVNYVPVDTDGDGLLYQSDSAHDFAVLGFSERIADVTGMMGLDQSFYSGTVNVTGYPGVYGGDLMTNDAGSAYVGAGVVYTDNLEINPGNSGGPVWRTVNGTAEVTGIVSTSSWAFWVGGSYYATLTGWLSANDSLIGGGGTDDFPGDATTTGTVTVSSAQTGTIETSSDHDWFKVSLEAGRTYAFNLEGAGSSVGTLSASSLALYSGADSQLAGNQGGGTGGNSVVAYAATSSGTYYLDAGSTSDAGSYVLSATAMAKDPANPWFDEDYYLDAKASAMNTARYQGRSDWTADSVKSLLTSAGYTPLRHYQTYGWREGLSPDPYFNQSQYLASKVAQMNSTAYQGRANWTTQDFTALWGDRDPFLHYRYYGAFEEGVNPSASFSDATYYAKKALETGSGSAATTMAAFESAGIDPISHFLAYGALEGVTPFA